MAQLQRTMFIAWLLAMLCACVSNPQTKSADRKALADLRAQIAAESVVCRTAEECANVLDAAQRWAALRPSRIRFVVKGDTVMVNYMEGNRSFAASIALDTGPDGLRRLTVVGFCSDLSAVVVPLSCGFASEQLE